MGRGSAAGRRARLAVTAGMERRAHWERVFEERGLDGRGDGRMAAREALTPRGGDTRERVPAKR